MEIPAVFAGNPSVRFHNDAGHRQQSGGLSGPAIKPIALLKVHQVYQVCREHGPPSSARASSPAPKDALEFLIAGARRRGDGAFPWVRYFMCRQIQSGGRQVLQWR